MDLGQIFTNKDVATYMVSLFCLQKNARILDPCFGEGAFLETLQEQGFYDIVGYEIDTALFEDTKSNYSNLELYNKDFLKADKKTEYDGIIMNPPYIRQEKIDELKPLGITKSKLRKNKLFKPLPSTANMYMYFILKAIDLLKDNGQLVVIFPGSWIQARSGHKFKELLYSKCTLLNQISLSGEVFEKDALVDVVILKLQKGSINADVCIENVEFSQGVINKRQEYRTINTVGFNIAFNQIGKVRRGLTTGCNEMYINPPLSDKTSKRLLVPIISSPKSIMGFGTKSAKTDTLFLPQKGMTLSEETAKYIKKWERAICKNKKPKTLFDKIKKDNSWYCIRPIKSQGILFGYFVRNDMKFIYNDADYLARDNFYVIEPNIDPLIVFALLNNYYTFFQLEKAGKKYGAGLLKIQRYDIEDLYFPDVESFSAGDKSHLRTLSQKLIDSGTKELLEEITKIVSKKSTVKYEDIIEQYKKVKKQRLEG